MSSPTQRTLRRARAHLDVSGGRDTRRAVRGLVFACALLTSPACAPREDTLAPDPVAYPRAEELDPDVREKLGSLLERAREHPGDAERHGELGLLYEANDLWREAEASFANAALLAPDEPGWRYHRALALRQAGEFTQALEALRDVAASAPAFAPAQERLGHWLVDAGDLEGAERAYLAALEHAPGAPSCLAGLADIRLAQGRPEEARQLAEDALRADPAYRLAHFTLGGAYRDLGRREESERELALGVGAERAHLADPLSLRLDEYRLNLSGRVNQAAEWIETGQAERAIALLEPALASHGEDVELVSNLGSAYQALGRFADAQRMFLRATRVDPGSFAGFLNLSICLLAQGEAAQALPPVQRALELAPELGAAHFAHGRVLAALARHVEALAAFELASRFDPDDGLVDVALAETLVRLERPDEALERYTRAVEKLPDHFPAHVLRGLVALSLGRTDVARAAAEAARKLDPDHPGLRELDRRLAEGRRP